MYCQNCGRDYEGNFCPNCGTPREPNWQPMRQQPQSAPPEKEKPLVKKWWFWALIAVALILVAAFLPRAGSDNDQKAEDGMIQALQTDAETEETKAVATEAPEVTQEQAASDSGISLPFAQTDEPDEPLAIEEMVLLNQGGIRVTATGLSEDAWLGPEINLLIENDTDLSVVVQAENVAVNGAMVSSLLYCDVAAGMKANSAISFYSEDLSKAGIQTIRTVELKLVVYDSSNYDTIVQSERLTITTNAAGKGEQTFDDSGLTVLDQNGLRFVLRSGPEVSIWGKDIGVFLENHTGKDIAVSLEGVSVNGFMVDPLFYCTLSDGTVAYTEISFSSDDLQTNKIDEFETMSFTVRVYRVDDWQTVLKSNLITVTFPF